jgi:steroid 5-alpha reductase family enzyme
MKTRGFSFFIIGLIYIVSISVGVITFLIFENLPDIARFFVADVCATLVIFICSLILKNASLYDPYWSVIPPLLLVGAAVYYQTSSFSVILVIASLSIWAIRLTYNWASLWHGFDEIDWRYDEMKQKAPKLYLLTNLFGIQLFPTSIVFVQLILAILFIEKHPTTNLLTLIGSLVIVLAAFIQLISDQQMKRFKKRTKGEKKCIEEGLWKYSRHPNYFGEVMVWWGIYLIYLSMAKHLDFMIISPIMMTSLFLFISIPWMERKIIRTRPEYVDYQKRVSMLVPFFRKEDERETSLKNA